ncbi:MnuA family membrane nuclease [Mycoplasmopsis gallinacea]|uniref:Uncharacterized protein n=1 Tax=Mycoplasmopsis gallinacea TaxID=29556 RepID=A0A6H0V2D0_9BACT|nr:hypothetical protein [Mycoplasmopsis gallinacea]QIW61884.1 hypothetical protein GOQ20_00125 [Mycoplasmopsis gallinacea]
MNQLKLGTSENLDNNNLNNVEDNNQPSVEYAVRHDLRIAHYNIKNFGILEESEATNEYRYKIKSLAYNISEINPDVIGITELNYNKEYEVSKIVDQLNLYSKSRSRNYKFILQTPEEADNPEVNSDTVEQIAIVYDANKIDPSLFSNNSSSASFHGSIQLIGENGTFTNKRKRYQRPPFGARFKLKSNNKFFTTIFAHFDSPGVKFKYGEISIKKVPDGNGGAIPLAQNQGNFEISEAYGLTYVIDYFKNLGAEKIIFAGDTNIKSNNEKAFITSFQRGYLAGWKDFNQDKYLTSFGQNQSIDAFLSNRRSTGYSQPYDKMIYDTAYFRQSEKNKDIFKLDVLNMYKNWRENKKNETYKSTIESIWNEEVGTSTTPSNYFSKTSDHLPVYIDLEFI